MLFLLLGLVVLAFILAVAYWVLSMWRLKQKRYAMFLEVLEPLDRRGDLLLQLVTHVQQGVKAKSDLYQNIQLSVARAKRQRQVIRKRLLLEEKLSQCWQQLNKMIQKYGTLRDDPAIMQLQIVLAEIEEDLEKRSLSFNQLTRRYNQSVERKSMQPIRRLLKFQEHRTYKLFDDDSH